MADLLSIIQYGDEVETLVLTIMDNLQTEGPVDYGDLEILSYVKLYQPTLFEKYERTILNLMGLYFKDNLLEDEDLRGELSNIIGLSIAAKFGHHYTPVQANLMDNLTDNRLFSFSSATSTGKSHVFRDLILHQEHDMVIVVPSRALINEYFTRTLKIVENMRVNVLVFPDVVNTEMAKRNVFILTPERVKDLFKLKDKLSVSTVLFDEAQMAEEDGRRGIYFDSIVRRVNENFQEARLLFAQPYIDNPDAQFKRNKLTDVNNSGIDSIAYPYRNVGQVFICVDGKRKYHHFAIDKNRLGDRKVAIDYDPIERCLSLGGSVLVYVPKSSIYTNEALDDMSEYVVGLKDIDNVHALSLIDKIGELLGGSSNEKNPFFSELLSLLGRGIVIHHGSLPLQARFLIEEFINSGYCRICFATSTLYQGVNMPFDIVYLKRLEESKPLLVKNLIGRAGRSTTLPVFDYGQVIIGLSRMSSLRNILARKNIMSEVSQIDVDSESDDVELAEFKQAIRNGQLNDVYNLTESQIERMRSEDTSRSVVEILDVLFSGSKHIDEVYNSLALDMRAKIVESFQSIFKQHVKDRDLSPGEAEVIKNAVNIFISQIGGRNLRSIIAGRFSYIARIPERKELEAIRDTEPLRYRYEISSMTPMFTMPAQVLPNKDLPRYGLFKQGTPIGGVGYDRVMYDTYDYIDKVWGFHLADIFYAAFDLYHSRFGDARAETMCKYIRYATIDETEIWLLRYGFSFEEIEWIKPLVITIDETKIEFSNLSSLSSDQLKIIDRYLPKSDDIDLGLIF